MPILKWLFGSNNPKPSSEPVALNSSMLGCMDDETAAMIDDVCDGFVFHATLQTRTPLCVI